MSPFVIGRRLFEIDGLLFLLREDQEIDRHIVATGAWEGDVDGYFRKTIEPGMVVVDVGANLGWYTMQAASLVGPQGLVVAFEPTDAAELVELHARLNGFSGRTIVNRQALGVVHGQRPGLFAFSYPENAPPESSYHQETVAFTTLDRLVVGADVLKIDVDGYEAEVIQGGLDYLAKHRPHLVLEVGKQIETLELEGHTEKLGLGSIFLSLSRLGYDVRDWDGERMTLERCVEKFGRPDIGSLNLFCTPPIQPIGEPR